MTRTTNSRPRMAASYAPGTVRALPRAVWWLIETKE